MIAAARFGSWERRVLRDALVVGLVTGAYGVSFGAVAVAAGLAVWQTSALSLFMFTGASQFAFAAEVAAGGSLGSAAATAVLLGSRNAFYGVRLAPLIAPRGWRRVAAAQVTLDESAAMSFGEREPDAARLAFWATGISVFVFWNLATLAGALSSQLVADPRDLGLDAAGPAAFVALLAPRLRAGRPRLAACVCGAVALSVFAFVPAGVPVLLAAVAAVALGLARSRPGTKGGVA